MAEDPKAPTLTTDGGAPVAGNQNSLTAGPRSPALMADYVLLEKRAHQNCERVPERTVHAKGSGAFGTFTVTHDITTSTKASAFTAIGTKTEVLARVDHRLGNDDYTQPGNLYRLMSADSRERGHRNMAAAMAGVPRHIVDRQLRHRAKADPAYAAGVARALGIKPTQAAAE